MTVRLRSTFLITPFSSSHGRRARRICSESGIPSRSCNRRIASSKSSSTRNVATLRIGVISGFTVLHSLHDCQPQPIVAILSETTLLVWVCSCLIRNMVVNGPDIPHRIRNIAGEVVHQLRSSLDHWCGNSWSPMRSRAKPTCGKSTGSMKPQEQNAGTIARMQTPMPSRTPRNLLIG